MAVAALLITSDTPGNVPTSRELSLGEFAINTRDGTLFFKKSSEEIVSVSVSGNTETFTNKTFDTSLTGNLFKVNGNRISGFTGEGSSVVLSENPEFTGQIKAPEGSRSTPAIKFGTNPNSPGIYATGGAQVGITIGGISRFVVNSSGNVDINGTVTSGVWAGGFGRVSGENLTNLRAENLIGSIPGQILSNTFIYIGSTQIPLNRDSGILNLEGVSIDGNAGTVTNGVYTTGSYSDPGWLTISKAFVGLGNVENVALSTWPGSSNINTIGTLTSGTVPWPRVGSTPTTLSGYGITDAQPLDADLTAIASLSASSGFLKKSAPDTWALLTDTGTVYQQPAPSNQWVINHNLGFKPSVDLYTNDGQEFEADVVHTSVNQTVVYLTASVAGFARLT